MATITMYDCDNDGDGIPENAQAVAGYLRDGNYDTLVARFPHAHHLGISTSAAVAGDCLDVEGGDASPNEAAAWVEARIKAGAYRPCVYASIDNYMPDVKAALAHLPRESYRLWVAHWTGVAHIEPGYDATQWQRVGDAYDESLLLADFFAPKPTPIPHYPTLSDTQKKELDNSREDLAGIVAHNGKLTKIEMDQLKLAYQRIGGIPGVK